MWQNDGRSDPDTETISVSTGGHAPRRVVCTGYCVGGSIAGVAAPWAAMTWPDADVRCITFGSLPYAALSHLLFLPWIVFAAGAMPAEKLLFGADQVFAR